MQSDSSSRDPRTVVGIDLGTTHCALASAELVNGIITVHEISQLVALGEVGQRPLLPSVLYLPGPELDKAALRMPWDAADRVPEHLVGELARSQGALVPGRVVHSAKSWLGHSRVDRLAAILPWGVEDGSLVKVSPVTVSAAYLSHLSHAFTLASGTSATDADVVLCVPASFDEAARQLTLRAAADAGLSPTLLEEPQAAFYAWLSDHLSTWREHLEVGDEILVCDVGGGTTDFSIIRVSGEKDGRPELERTAVGEHLLLGGDNMDLSLARRVEARIKPDGKLESAQFSALLQACRVAKERLLDDASAPDAKASWTVTVAGRGSRLFGGAMHDEVQRSEVEALILDGFFPRVGADAIANRSRSALQEFGLPYAADPAVTRHLAAFLRQHGSKPKKILWNGGVTKSPAIRARLLEIMGSWLGAPPVELPDPAPDLAVARGAAYYGLARRGKGLRIGGGSMSSYYVGVDTADVTPGQISVLCVAPRGLVEGERVRASHPALEALANRPVRFRLFSSLDLKGDLTGDRLVLPEAELTEQAPLYTVLRYPRSSQEVALQVSLETHLSELGALEIECVATSTGNDSDRWRLAFDLRAVAAEPAAPPAPAPVEDPRALQLAMEMLRALYEQRTGESEARFAELQPPSIMKALQSPLGPKDTWSPTTLRALWEPLKDLRGGRGKSAPHEARWMNLVGYCLRPGFGYALDDWRVKETWRLFNAGLVHEKDQPCRLEWWVMWRRISGGLTKTQQDEIWKRLQPYLLPKPKMERKPVARQELAEMWRTIASMERLPARTKSDLGDALLNELEKKSPPEHAMWALGRLGARVPLYGAVHETVSAKKAERWLERLLALTWKGEPEALAAVEIARMSGDRSRDLDEALRKRLAERLREQPDGQRLVRVVLEPIAREAKEERLAFGDALPQGLRLSEPPLGND